MKRILPFVVVILLLLAGVASVPFLLSPEKHRPQITEALSKALGRSVVLGPMSLGYFPPTLKIDQVAVRDGAGNPILQAGTVAAPLDWAALFHLKLSPRDVEIKRWTLTITRMPDGRWDIEEWIPQTAGLSGAKTSPLRGVRWNGGEIHWIDTHAGSPQELVLGSVEGHWEPRPETIDSKGIFSGAAAGVNLSWTAKGQFFSSPQWTGDLVLSDQGNSAAFHLTRTPDALDIKGQAPHWNYANALSFLKFYGRGSTSSSDSSMVLALENWQVHARSQGARVTFEHSASISGGLSEAKGTVDATPAGLLLHADIAAKDVPVEVVFNLAGQKPPMEGKLTLVAKGFEAMLSGTTLSTLKGEGYAELKDGRYPLPELTVKKLAKAKTMAYVRKKFPDLVEKGFPITKLSGHWNAKAGTAMVDDGQLVSTDMKLAWVGKLDLAKQGLDGHLAMRIREKDVQMKRLIPVKYYDQPAYGRLQGTWDGWTLKALPMSKIPSANRSKLQKSLR